MQRASAREKAFLLLFENSFNGYSLNKIIETKSLLNKRRCSFDAFTSELFNGVKKNEEKLDSLISSCSVRWSKDRLSRISLCILRVALYEILFREDIPENVSASEAVNLAKKYGTDVEYTFVNGILGTVCSKNKKKDLLVGCVG